MISFPFTSDGGDRKVYTKDFRMLFSKYFTNGVFDGGFAVTPATGMKVNISAGWCNINGVFGYSEETIEKQIETVSSETYFNIVLRLDDNKATRNIEIYVVKGTSTPPKLTRNETVYELCIARIKVGVSDQSITLSMIEDTRLKTDLCGIVANAVQVLDTDTYYNQFQGALDEFLDTVDQALDGTLAGNLQNQINKYWEKIYPVGSIYMSVNNTNPSTLFGGKWEEWGAGRVPISVNKDDTNYNIAEMTGGSERKELRAMIGAVNSDTGTIGYKTDYPVIGEDMGSYTMLIRGTGEGPGTFKANHTTPVKQIDGKDLSLLQPYITCYMWKRVK